MDLSSFGARATAGTLRDAPGVVFPHAWTVAGLVAGLPANGAQVLHLSVALCVLNDIYREAARLREQGLDVIELESPASEREEAHLLRVVDGVAEIPRAIRAGASVTRHK